MKRKLLLMDKEGTIKDYKKMEKLEAENKRLREALSLVINFIPDRWEMPIGFNIINTKVRQALKGK